MGVFAFAATGAYACCGKCKCEGCPKPAYAKMKPGAELTAEQKAEIQAKIDEFETKLQLTDEQKAQTKVMRDKHMAQMKPLMKKMQTLKAEYKRVQGLKVAQATKDARLAKIKADKSVVKEQMVELRKKQHEEFEAILTAKQKKELDKMKKDMKKKMEAKRKACAKCDCGCKKKEAK